MIQTYNPFIFFKGRSIKDIKDWADHSYQYELYEKDGQFLVSCRMPSNAVVAIIYTTFGTLPEEYIEKINKAGFHLIVAPCELDNFKKLKNAAKFVSFAPLWDVEFLYYAYTQ